MKPIHILCALTVAVCWGMNFAASKYSVAHFPPFTTTGLRYSLVSLLLLPLLFTKPEKGWRDTLILSCLMVTIHFGFAFTAIWMGLSISSTVIFIQMGAPFSCILSAVLFKDFMGPWRSAGMGLAFIGVIIVSGGAEMDGKLIPILFALCAACAWASTNVFMKHIGSVKILPLLAWTGLLSLPQMAVLIYLLEPGFFELLPTAPATAWGGIIYSAVFSTLVGYGLWYLLIREYSVSQVTPYSLLVPIVGVLSGVFMFDEVFTFNMGIGAALTLAGVAIITLRRPKIARVEQL